MALAALQNARLIDYQSAVLNRFSIDFHALLLNQSTSLAAAFSQIILDENIHNVFRLTEVIFGHIFRHIAFLEHHNEVILSLIGGFLPIKHSRNRMG